MIIRNPFIAVLEDDERRQAEMSRLLAEFFPAYSVVFFDTAPDMIAWLTGHLPEIALLCLDHDLGPSRLRNGERFEPGCRRDVADFVAAGAIAVRVGKGGPGLDWTCPPVCEVSV